MLVLSAAWLQMVTKKTPSMTKLPYLAVTNMALVYLGYPEPSDEMLSIYETNEHALLLNSKTRKKCESYLDINLIPKEYQIKEPDLNGKNLLQASTNSISKNSLLVLNRTFAEKALLLFSDDLSPSLVNDKILKQYPLTVIYICDRDPLRDEQFIFAERMKRLGVNVQIKFDSCPHTNILKHYESNPRLNDLVSFIKKEFKL